MSKCFEIVVFIFVVLSNPGVGFSQSIWVKTQNKDNNLPGVHQDPATCIRKSTNESSPELKFRFEKDSATFLDTVKINVILGSTVIPIDSIYDLSFSCWINNLNNHNVSLNSYYSIET